MYFLSLFLTVWMIFLYSTISSSKSISVMVVSHRQASALFAPAGHLHRLLDASGLAGWLDGLLQLVICSVLRLLLRLVSVVALWFVLRAVGHALACCWLCFSRFFSLFLPFSTLSAALRTPRRFDVLLAVLAPVLLLYLLFTTGSSAVVLSPILTTGFLAVVPSVFLSHHWILGSGSLSDPPQRHFVVSYIFRDVSPAPLTPQLIAPLVIVGSRLVLGLLGRVVYNVFC